MACCSHKKKTVKCACPHCSCQVDPATAVVKDGKTYCCEACADGHKTQATCGHAGCVCK